MTSAAPYDATAAAYNDLAYSQHLQEGDTVRLVCDGARITCADLDALSTRISAQLRRAGLRESQIVGLVARRSIEATAAILGICRRGLPATGYLLPPKLLRYICRDSDLAHRWARGLAQAIVTLASRPARREDFPPRIMPAL